MPQVNGTAIRERRSRTGKKPPEFATLLGISRSHLANLELGHKEASMEVVHRLANYFGVRAAEILTRESATRLHCGICTYTYARCVCPAPLARAGDAA